LATRDIPETDPDKLRNKYPSNSYAKRDREESQTDISRQEKPKQVAKGKVRKQGLFRKFARYIVEDTIESARERTFMDIIVPGLKTLIFDTGTELLDLMLFGGYGDAPRSSRRHSGGHKEDRVSYSRYYDERGRKSSQKESYRTTRESMEPDDIILDTRREAQNVLEELDYIIHKYGQASIADYYDIVGVTSNWTDNHYGWVSIRNSFIKPVRDGFMIILPRTQELDD